MCSRPCDDLKEGADCCLCRRFSLYEPVEFINTFLKDKLEWNQVGSADLVSVICDF